MGRVRAAPCRKRGIMVRMPVAAVAGPGEAGGAEGAPADEG